MQTHGNILLVANWESNVGYAWWLMENFWLTISRHFRKQEITCYLIYPKVTRIPESLAGSDIQVIECDFRDRSLRNLLDLRNLVKSNAIRYIYLTDMPYYSIFYCLLRLWGIKRIVVHDHTPGDRTISAAWLKPAKSLVQNIPFYTADHYIAVTDFVHDRLVNISRIPEKKCSVAPNGIVPIDLSNADSTYAHRVFGIPDDRIIVVTTGRASYYKGIDFFIRCADELVNKQGYIQLHFLFCGDGPDIQDFRDLATRLDIESHFTFAGKRSDVIKILPSCQIGFHAAAGEVGYSLSILEYMSAGLVTIVPDRPSTSGATQHLVTGLVYRHGDLDSACNAIKKSLSTELAETMSRNAIDEVINSYNLRTTNEKLISILANVYS